MKKLVLILIIALTLSGAGLVATVASYPVEVNGEPLNVTVLNHNGTTYLPIRAVSESLGVPIEWTGKVEIQTVDVDELKEACVAVLAQNPKDGMKGSGVYIDYDEILTAQHVVDGMDRFTVNGYMDLGLKDSDKGSDSAILETPHKKKPVKIGDSDEIKIGDGLIIIATPLGGDETVEYTTMIGQNPAGEGFMAMASVGAGSSGGAVFDMYGCLVGIIIAGDGTTEDGSRVRNLIMPINEIREAL
jgi:S1-C subfamily serine protease